MHTIVLGKDGTQFTAEVKGALLSVATGSSHKEAVGNLILRSAERFGFIIEMSPDLAAQDDAQRRY